MTADEVPGVGPTTRRWPRTAAAHAPRHLGEELGEVGWTHLGLFGDVVTGGAGAHHGMSERKSFRHDAHRDATQRVDRLSAGRPGTEEAQRKAISSVCRA